MRTAKAELPKYLQISADVMAMIRRGTLPAGGRAPSENEMIGRYGVSNTTARKALAELERAGWVTRIKGRGTERKRSRAWRVQFVPSSPDFLDCSHASFRSMNARPVCLPLVQADH